MCLRESAYFRKPWERISGPGRKLDLARSSGLVKGNTKNMCAWLNLMVVCLKEEEQAGDSVQW